MYWKHQLDTRETLSKSCLNRVSPEINKVFLVLTLMCKTKGWMYFPNITDSVTYELDAFNSFHYAHSFWKPFFGQEEGQVHVYTCTVYICSIACTRFRISFVCTACMCFKTHTCGDWLAVKKQQKYSPFMIWLTFKSTTNGVLVIWWDACRRRRRPTQTDGLLLLTKWSHAQCICSNNGVYWGKQAPLNRCLYTLLIALLKHEYAVCINAVAHFKEGRKKAILRLKFDLKKSKKEIW